MRIPSSACASLLAMAERLPSAELSVFSTIRDERVSCLGEGDERGIASSGLPWPTSEKDVRLVERVRPANPGPSSTASIHLHLARGGHEVVAVRSLTNHTRIRAALAVAVVLVAGACSGDGTDSAPPLTSTTTTTAGSAASSSTSTTVAADEAAVRAGYEAASRAFIEAAAVPDPDSTAVADTHTGPMLEQRLTTLRGLRAEGKAIRYPTPSQYRIEIEEVAIDGDVARLSACVIDDGQRVEASTGDAAASGVGTVLWKAAMRRVDGSWRLAERVEEDRWDGVAGCAVE